MYATESQLIDDARRALSDASWTAGLLALEWQKRFQPRSNGATFGPLVGLSDDQVEHRVRVVFKFIHVREAYPNLVWSHFYAALEWDDAAECLKWADEMKATVVEMKAWRRAQHGEDLDAAASELKPRPSKPANDPLARCRALTICEPFASLISHGMKRVENRTWDCKFRGPLLIHAGKSKEWLDYYDGPTPPLTFGAIVAVADVIDCVPFRKASDVSPVIRERHPWLPAHEHSEGPFCIVLANVDRLLEPIPCAGAQGLWNPPPEVLRAVSAAATVPADTPAAAASQATTKAPEAPQAVPEDVPAPLRPFKPAPNRSLF